MKKVRDGDGRPPWGALPLELIQDVFSFLYSHELAIASMTCHAWRAAACAMVTHLTLPLNHPLLIAGPAPGWAELVERTSNQPGTRRRPTGDPPPAGARPSSSVASPVATPPRPGGCGDCGSEWLGPRVLAGSSYIGAGPSTLTAAAAVAAAALPYAVPGSPFAAAPPRGSPLPRLRTQFPMVTHITLIHNAMLHRAQVHAAMSTLHALWPAVRGISVHDGVTWDLPLDYSALGVMTHITSLELLFQGQGGMDEAGQPLYRASMPHLCRLAHLKELCMKWIIGYDVDSFLDFNEVYDLLASIVRHNQLRSLQFGGENINAEGARHLASITTLETLNLVCDARPASPLHLLDMLTLPRLTRLELTHVCPDHAWNAAPPAGEPQRDPLAELNRRAAALAASPLRSLALSLSPGCQALVSRVLPLLPHLHSLAVRVTSSEEEEALGDAFRAMQTGTGTGAAGPAGAPPLPPPREAWTQPSHNRKLPLQSPSAAAASPSASVRSAAPPLRALRLETAELGAELVGAVATLTALTSLQLPRGLPTGEVTVIDPTATAEAVLAAAANGGGVVVPPPQASKYTMGHLSSLGRLTCLQQLMIQMDSPADTVPAFVDGSLVSVLTGLPSLDSLHLSTWNLLGVEPSAEALGAYPQRQQHLLPLPGDSPPVGHHHHRRNANANNHRTDADQQTQQQQQSGRSGEAATEAALEPAGSLAEAAADGSGGGADGSGSHGEGQRGAAAAAPELRRPPRQSLPCLPPLPTWAWPGLRSLSLTHWPCVYGKLREAGPPQPGRCYAVRWDDLPGTLEALLLVRCQLAGSRPPPRLRHMWLADCVTPDTTLAQVLAQTPELETLVLRWPSSPAEEPEPLVEATASLAARPRAPLAAITALQNLRTLGLGGIRCQDMSALAPLTRLRHLMLEPLQPARPPLADAPASQRDLTLLDVLMALPAGALAGLRTLWLPNWAMPIKQLLQWQQMLQAAMPLVVLRVTEYDVVWTVPTPVMHVARVEAPSSLTGGSADAGGGGGGGGAEAPGARRPGWSSGRAPLHAGRGLDGQELEWWHIGCWSVQ